MIFGDRSVIFGGIRNLRFSCIPLIPLDFYLSDAFHVAVAFALSPDFGSTLSKKAKSLMVPAAKTGHTEDGSHDIPLGPNYCCSTG